jgi:hypothetical protein
LSSFCEALDSEKDAKANLSEDELERLKIAEGMFDADELKSYT